MTFLAAFFVLFYVKERVSRSKLLQKVSGINDYVYWIASFISDYLILTVVTVLLVITLYILKQDFTVALEVALMMLFYGWGILPLVYICSSWFTVPSTGYSRLSTLFIITGPVMSFIVFGLKDSKNDFWSDVLNVVFIIIPIHPMLSAMKNIGDLAKFSEDSLSGPSFFQWSDPGCAHLMVALLFDGFFWFSVLFFLEFGMLQRAISKLRAKRQLQSLRPVSPDEDADVKNERQRVHQMSVREIQDTNLVIKDLAKFYGKFLAVNQLCVAVDGGECFGLLGVNGAGKTTTFKMLTGEERPTFGHAWIQGISLIKNLTKANQHVGYCPQFDALLEDLTGMSKF